MVTREHAKGDVAFRGPAEALLLFLWGRDGGPSTRWGTRPWPTAGASSSRRCDRSERETLLAWGAER